MSVWGLGEQGRTRSAKWTQASAGACRGGRRSASCQAARATSAKRHRLRASKFHASTCSALSTVPDPPTNLDPIGKGFRAKAGWIGRRVPRIICERQDLTHRIPYFVRVPSLDINLHQELLLAIARNFSTSQVSGQNASVIHSDLGLPPVNLAPADTSSSQSQRDGGLFAILTNGIARPVAAAVGLGPQKAIRLVNIRSDSLMCWIRRWLNEGCSDYGGGRLLLRPTQTSHLPSTLRGPDRDLQRLMLQKS